MTVIEAPGLIQKLKLLTTAHLINDNKTAIAKATCALIADRRWAVTARPIQTHTLELFGVSRFLQMFQYDDTEPTYESQQPQNRL